MTRRRPRVAMIGKFLAVRGGLEEYVNSLADAIADDCDLTLIVHGAERTTRTIETGRYRIVSCGTLATIASQPLSPSMLTALNRETFDIVHLHVPNVLGIAAVERGLKEARLVVTHHADMVGFGLAGRIAIAAYRRLLRRASAITVLSLKNRELARDIGPTEVPFHTLPIGLDPARFVAMDHHVARGRELRARAGSRPFVMSFVGRLVPYKGLDVLIDALSACPEAAVLIAGEGKERAALEAQAAARGVADRAVFLGGISDDDRLALLSATDAFVLPSINSAEAFGIVQVEAQLARLAIITTDLPTGVTDVTRADETGLIVPPQDAAALANAIQRLAGNPGLRRQLGEAGYARALGHYTKAAVSGQARAIYDQVLASPLPAR